MRWMVGLWLVLSSFNAGAQSFDTLRVMTYNLCYYGEYTSFCTSSNNGISAKDDYLKTVLQHALPDVLVVNEMGASASYTTRILNKALNVDGHEEYAACAVQNNSFSSLVNGVFYNSDKLSLASQSKVSTHQSGSNLVRVLDINSFYYLDPSLDEAAAGDTVFIHVVAAHLKAGSETADEAERGIAAEALMDYLEAHFDPGYFVLMGDLNLKGSSESAFQVLTSSTYGDRRFLDPLQRPGNWNNNSSFSDLHTQSTRSSQTNGGCFSGGGLDDRFDLILMSDQILQDTGKVRYVDESYTALGQDGSHFNAALNAPLNSSAPAAVIEALYGMSDHLPVIAQLAVQQLPLSGDTNDTGTYVPQITDPFPHAVWVQHGQLRLQVASKVYADVYSISGALVSSEWLNAGYHVIPLYDWPAGVYIVRIHDAQTGQVRMQKVLAQPQR